MSEQRRFVLRYTVEYGHQSGTYFTTKEEALKGARKIVNQFMRRKGQFRFHRALSDSMAVMVYEIRDSHWLDVIERYRVSRDCDWH